MKIPFQQRLQMLAPELQQKFIAEQQAEWAKFVLNVDIPREYRTFAFSFETYASLSVKPDYFAMMMFDEVPELKLPDAIIFCRACVRTFHEWIVSFGSKAESKEEYRKYIVFCDEVTRKVNESCEPIADALLRKMEAMQKLQLNSGGRKIAMA